MRKTSTLLTLDPGREMSRGLLEIRKETDNYVNKSFVLLLSGSWSTCNKEAASRVKSVSHITAIAAFSRKQWIAVVNRTLTPTWKLWIIFRLFLCCF